MLHTSDILFLCLRDNDFVIYANLSHYQQKSTKLHIINPESNDM
jgi:hypothetical protein